MAKETANFVRNGQVFILDSINTANTADLIADMTDLVTKLPHRPATESRNYTITNPYILPGKSKPTVLDITINSNGGVCYPYQTISALISRAKSMGAIVRIMVGGIAASSASLLAIQGTPGFRIMYESSRHMIHWGTYPFTFDRESDVDKMADNIRDYKEKINEIYLQFTKIPARHLKQMMNSEASYLTAAECLKLNVCDWILCADGKFIGRNHTR